MPQRPQKPFLVALPGCPEQDLRVTWVHSLIYSALFQLSAHKPRMPGHRRLNCLTGPVFPTKTSSTLA